MTTKNDGNKEFGLKQYLEIHNEESKQLIGYMVRLFELAAIISAVVLIATWFSGGFEPQVCFTQSMLKTIASIK